jgi:surface polysaccharide O-acyltransferase-like enzyme
VVVLNALMLVLGYMGEMGVLPVKASVGMGFLPFLAYYSLIYQDFVSPAGEKIYWYFVVVWSVYGFAALLPYHPKNTLYNVLDLFAKNFFGVYLSYLLYVHRQSSSIQKVGDPVVQDR